MTVRIRGIIPWRASFAVGVSAGIGAVVGGLLIESSPRRVLMFLVGALVTAAGLREAKDVMQAYLKRRAAAQEHHATAKTGKAVQADPSSSLKAPPGFKN